MEINKNNNISNIANADIVNNLAGSPPRKNEIICEASYSSFDEALIVRSDKKNWTDASVTYYINKDGSCKKDTAWGWKTYPEGTFKELLDEAKSIYLEGQKYSFSNEESLLLLDKITQTIENLNKKDIRNG